MPGSGPTTRRNKGSSKSKLNREAIISAALVMVKSKDERRITLRRIAAELDTGPASIYVYFRNASELNAAILDELLRSVPRQRPAQTADSLASVTRTLWSYCQVLARHPSFAHSALVTRPFGPRYLSIVDGLLRTLLAGGASEGQAAWGADLLLQYATSTAIEHGTRHGSSMERDEEEIISRVVDNIDHEKYPAIAGLGRDILSGSPRERFEWDVSAVYAGIVSAPRPRLGRK
jgi:AcrR family transcriptional regulator